MNRTFEAVRLRLAEHGLGAAGFEAGPEDSVPPRTRTMILATGANPELWSRFQASPERRDGRPDPLDRWSRRVIGAVAGEFDGIPHFPGDGPPYLPFLSWSRRAAPVWPSPIGLFVHAEFGLWYSCRGAIAFPQAIPLPDHPVRPRPCDSCAGRPCASACPVGAFDGGRFDAERCRSWLRIDSGIDCRTRGCLARRACPVGDSFAHPPARAELHMAAFLSPVATGSG